MFEIIENNSDRTFLLKGDINTFNIEALDLLIGEEDGRNVVLDFKNANIDSKAITSLSHTKRKLEHTNRKLKIVNIPESVQRILVLAGIDISTE